MNCSSWCMEKASEVPIEAWAWVPSAFRWGHAALGLALIGIVVYDLLGRTKR